MKSRSAPGVWPSLRGVTAGSDGMTRLLPRRTSLFREIPLHPELRSALIALQTARGEKVRAELPVVYSERGRGYSAAAISVWFHTRFAELRIEGASSHSGRRTFITTAAKNIVKAGGSLRDVQELAGHTSLATTQRYIQGDSEAKRNVIKLI
jgi:integrase